MELTDAIRILTDKLTKSTQSYTEAINDLSNNYGKGKRSERERDKQQKNAELQAAKKTVDAFDQAYKAVLKWKAEAKHGGTEEVQAAAEDLGKSLNGLVKSGLASDDLTNIIQNLNGVTADQTDEVEKLTKQIQKETAKHIKNIKVSEKEVKLHTKLLNSFDNLSNKAKSVANDLFSVKAGIANVSAGFIRSFDELNYSMKHQAEMYTMLNGLGETWAADMSLAPIEMQQYVADNRRLINAAASDYTSASDAVTQSVNAMNKQTKLGTTVLEQAYQLTGNFKDASALIAGTMNTLQGIGIKKPFDVLTDESTKLINEFKGLSRVTGQSSESIQQQVAQYFQSAEAREELLKMDDKQRRNRVLEVAESMKYQVMLGRSTQAALEAQKAMSRIAGMDTKTRLKEGAMMQAVASSMGLKSGARMAELFRKPTRTAAEEKEFQKYANTLAQEYRSRQKQGGGTAMAAEAVFGRLSSETQSIINAQNVELDKGFALSQKQYKVLADNQPKLGMIEKGMQGLKQFWEQNIRGFVMDPAVQILGGIAGILKDIVFYVAMSAGLNKLGLSPLKLLGENAKKLLPTFTGLSTKLGSFTSSLTIMGKSLAKIAGGLGAVLGGWEIGQYIGGQITDYWEKNDPEGRAAFGDALGSMVDNSLAFFGNEAAKDRLALIDAYEKNNAPDKKEQDFAKQMQDLINELREATQNGNEERRALLNEQIKALNNQTSVIKEQTEVQKEANEKALEQEKTKLRTAYMATR